MATEKITKAMVLDMILACEECSANADIVAYCENEKELLAKKADKAKARAADKKAAGDELRAIVEAVLQNATEPMTREMVLASIESDEELTVAKVGARITQLVQLGIASKTKIKVDGKEKTAYVYGSIDAE